MKINYHIEIRGNVNHLGNKLKIMILANQCNIAGSVSEKEHQLEIEAEGNEKDLKDFIEICRKKFAGEGIVNMTVKEQNPTYYDDFSIL